MSTPEEVEQLLREFVEATEQRLHDLGHRLEQRLDVLEQEFRDQFGR